MVTSIVLIALIGTLQFNSAISAAINYEPIKITVNENFNAQPGQVSSELQQPGVLHQGANFYFKPQLNLPPSYIPSRIEALISLIQQYHHSCAKDTSKMVFEEDKLKEILKQFMSPLWDISKETLSEIVLEKENNLEIVKPIIIAEDSKPVALELLVIPEAPVLPPSSLNGGIPSIVKEEVKKEESVTLEEPTGVFPRIPELAVKPITEPIINYVDPKPVFIPEAPVLPPLFANDMHVVEEVKIEEPIVVDVEPKPATQELTAIPEAPVLPSFSLHDISSIIEEEVKKEESIIFEEPTGELSTIPEIAVRPIEEPIINNVEPKPIITSELVFIPEAPVLPPLTFNGFPFVVEEEVKKEESIILGDSTGVFPPISEVAARPITEPIINYGEPKSTTSGLAVIPEAPVLPPLSLNDIHVFEEEVKSEEPIIVDVEPKPAIQELVAIPEAPVLPSFSLHDISSIIEEEVKKEESIILEEPTGVFPTIPEIVVKPITEPIINYVDPKLVFIPEAPVLPPLKFNGFPFAVEEEVKKDESIILGGSTGVFPTITQIAARPITEPIINYGEPEPAIQDLVEIPEAPVLPPLSLNDIHVFEEEVKIEEPIILEEPTGVFPTIPEIVVKPITEPIINYVDPEPVFIPEAPVLPPLKFNGFPFAVEEEVKKDESIILGGSTGVFPTITQIAARPITEPIINYGEPEPAIQDLVEIPEAPVLPPLSLNDIHVFEEEVKIEEPIILEEPTGVFPTIPEIVVKPITEPIINYVDPEPVFIPEAPVLPPLFASDMHVVKEVKIEEPIVVDVEPKPATQELTAIPEAPVLPSFSLHDISSIIEEEVKKEESIILEEPTGVFPTIPEIVVKPITEPIINYVDPKLVFIPEAPVLPPLKFNGFPFAVEEEVKKDESIILGGSTGVFPTITQIAARPITEPIINYGEPEPAIQDLVEIPEAPVLPPLSLNDIHVFEEEVKIEEPIILEEPTGVFPTIPEIVVKPITEPIINYVDPEPVFIPEAPVLPPLKFNGFPFAVEEEVKKDESIILGGSTGVFPTITQIAARPITEPIINYGEPEPAIQDLVEIPEAPVLPPLSLNDIHVFEEEVKIEEPIILEEPTGVFPTIPEIVVKPITEPIINYVDPEPVFIPEAPVLPPLFASDMHVVKEVKIEEPIVVDVEPKPATQELTAIPEAPVLPSFSLHDISSIIEEEVKKEESIIFEEPTGGLSTIPEIAVRPIEEPIINYVEPKPIITSELVFIPEAPVLPPLTFNGFPFVVEEEVKKEESIILGDSTGVFPTISEVAARPITEPIINYGEPKSTTSGLAVIPEAPVLPPLSLNDIHVFEEEVKSEEPIIVDVEPKPAIQELVAIPEAPVLPSFSLHDISSIIEEEVKKEESIILEEPTGVFPTIPEIAGKPITEPIINYVDPKPVFIPEAPLLPPLKINGFPFAVEEEVKKEESIILGESTGVFPTIRQIAARPITEPIINYGEHKSTTSGLAVIPEAPVLPPLSLNDIHVIEEEVKIEETIIADVEPKPAIQELVAIPEAPVLPSFSLHDISSVIEEVKKEESIILEEPTDLFPTIPEIAGKPITEPIINYVNPKPVFIPEAPLLPPLKLNGFPLAVEEEVKKEESIILRESTGVFPTITQISARPITEPIINYGEPEPASQDLVDIPEAPVLPSFSLHDISAIIEEVKKEESIILEEPTGEFPTIPEIDVRPIEEPIFNHIEPKPIPSELVVIPEAPVLPLLSFNGFLEGPVLPPVSANVNHVVEEEVEIEEPVIVDTEPKPVTSEVVVIPEAPVLPPLSYNGISPVVEEVKKEVSCKIPEISARPFPEPLENNKPSETAEFFALENNIFPIATEEVKIEIPILLEESIEVFPPIAEISSGSTLQESSPKITDSYVFEEVSQPNPESALTVKETLPPTIISKPSNHLGVFSYVPFISHLSNLAPKTNNLMTPKPASLERFLLMKHPFTLPVKPFPKLNLNAIKSSIWGNKKQFLNPTSYAHDVVEKRIAPNMAFKKQNAPKRVKIYIRSNVQKGPSYL